MSTEYNSILLAKLISTEKEDEIKNVLSEIEEIRDSIFLYPVHALYKENKKEYFSYYFIDALAQIDSVEVVPILIEIGSDPEIERPALDSIIRGFDRKRVYDQRAIQIALDAFALCIPGDSDEDPTGYYLYSILPYLKNASALGRVEKELLSISSDEKIDVKSREYAFGKWLEIDPGKNIQICIDSYDTLKANKEKELLVARVISTWTGDKSEKLKKLIESQGTTEAKLIIQRSREKDQEKNKKDTQKKQKEIKQQYSNADLVEKMTTLRSEINEAAKANLKIDFNIFLPDESITSHMKAANDQATFMKACIDMRELISNLSEEIQHHGVSEAEIRKILPEIDEKDFDKPLNRLFLYLHSRDLKVDIKLFGLRPLNQIVSLAGAHPKSEKKELIKRLKVEGLDEAYKNSELYKVHQYILQQYINSLQKLLEAISDLE